MIMQIQRLSKYSKHIMQIILMVTVDSLQKIKGVLNPNFRPFIFESKKVDF